MRILFVSHYANPHIGGIETVILCPEDTPEANVREIALQGGRVWRVTEAGSAVPSE